MVRYVPDKTGRFAQRPHYESIELDRECESIINGFLMERYGKICFPIKTADLTVLIEQKVEDFDSYADLSAYGEQVEGLTEFVPGQKPNVKISKTLSGDDRRKNRLRTTLAHEYGHVHLHSYLWEVETPRLLETDASNRELVCKRETILEARQSDWMEWQAGYVCGSLLMPVSQVKRIVSAYQEDHGLSGIIGVPTSHAPALIEEIRQKFQVSEEAARIRLIKLNVLGQIVPGHLEL